MMCRLYDVTRDGYYAWKRRGRSSRQLEDESLYDAILEVFRDSGELYGSPKVTAALRDKDYKVSKMRVARIMQENGLKARRACIYRPRPGMHQSTAYPIGRWMCAPMPPIKSGWATSPT